MRPTERGDQRIWRVRVLLLHAALLAAPLALLAMHRRFDPRGPGACVWRGLFGADCPGCGMTRSAMALLNGDALEAIRLHPAGPLVVALLAVIVTYLVLTLFTRFRGLEWGREIQALTGIEVLAFSALVMGWMERGLLE